MLKIKFKCEVSIFSLFIHFISDMSIVDTHKMFRIRSNSYSICEWINSISLHWFFKILFKTKIRAGSRRTFFMIKLLPSHHIYCAEWKVTLMNCHLLPPRVRKWISIKNLSALFIYLQYLLVYEKLMSISISKNKSTSNEKKLVWLTRGGKMLNRFFKLIGSRFMLSL